MKFKPYMIWPILLGIFSASLLIPNMHYQQRDHLHHRFGEPDKALYGTVSKSILPHAPREWTIPIEVTTFNSSNPQSPSFLTKPDLKIDSLRQSISEPSTTCPYAIHSIHNRAILFRNQCPKIGSITAFHCKNSA